MQDFTTDFFVNQDIKIDQPEKGYRFSIDPFLLCSEIPPIKKQTVLDIGCGSGIIPILLKLKNPGITIFGVEIQKELADIAKKNIEKNSMGQNIRIICKDINQTKVQNFGEKIDMIVSNPPYKKENTGRLNPDIQKAVARHEIRLNIEEFFICCKRLLKKSGVVYIIFPAERISDILNNMEKRSIKPSIIRFIHTKKDSNAKLVIVSGINNGLQQPQIIPPLIINDCSINTLLNQVP